MIKTLSHQEIRDVKKCVKSIQYRKDIFGELPLELSQRIAGYLGLPDSVRARRVSKTWLNILGSAQTTRILFRPWQGLGDSRLRIPEGLSSTAVSSLEAECIYAYRTGKAFDRSTILASLPRHGSICNHVAYSSGRVAWINKRTYTTHLLTLDNSHHRIKKETHDVVLSHIALSGSMMVVATLSGQCRVRELSTGLEHRFQLIPPNVQCMVVSRGTVAILHTPFNDSLEAKVTTWTLDGRKVVHFFACLHRSLDQGLKPCDLKIMLDASGARVIIVERVTEAGLVHFTRFGLDGHVQVESTLGLPDLEGWRRHSEEDIATHANEWATVWSYSKEGAESSDSAVETTVTTEVLRVQCHVQRGYLRLKKDSYNFSMADDRLNVFYWNDVAYSQTCIGGGMTHLSLIDFSTSSMDYYTFMGIELEYESWDMSETGRRLFRNAGGMAQSIFLGDHRFLVNVCRHGFFIWVFDKGHSMIKCDKTYQKRRKEMMKTRKGHWVSLAQLDDC